MAKLPSKLDENSGIAYLGNDRIWVVEDNGNKDHIYAVNFEGKLVKEFKVKNGKNHDWEDLTNDTNGNLYIGDFGNNANERKNLAILKLPNPEKESGKNITAKKISFSYPEQKHFPPKKSKLLFDAEAFFHWGESLYIITKNRARPYSGLTYIYKVPDSEGVYEAVLVGQFITCKDSHLCSVTSADISSDGKKIALIGSGGMLWLFTDFKWDDFSKGNMQSIDLHWRTQIESVCFLDDDTLLISDEQSQSKGRNLYSLNLKKVKIQNLRQN